jgi:hypothetical protein
MLRRAWALGFAHVYSIDHSSVAFVKAVSLLRHGLYNGKSSVNTRDPGGSRLSLKDTLERSMLYAFQTKNPDLGVWVFLLVWF